MDRTKTYHFTGIKGSGMSALALVLHGEGYRVQGSDVEKIFFTQKGLEEAGIPFYPFSAELITEDMIVIAGNAFPDTHEEIVRAKELGVEVIRYHVFLGNLLQQYTSIAITGAHGKTSTTGLMSHVLKGMAPTSYLIGDGTGFGDEGADFFVLEACEYRRHFLAYKPDYAIITNIDFDHPDYYKDLEDVISAFKEFGNQVKEGLVVCGDDEHLREMAKNYHTLMYGLCDHNDVQAKNIEKTTQGSSFDVYQDGEKFGHFKIPMFGTHNILNSLAVIAIAKLEGFSAEAIAENLLSYQGVKRRFSEKEIAGVKIIDDYAHHPNEIKATIEAAKQKYPNQDIVAVFQPHTFSRTEALLEEFADTLALADYVYLCDIFASAREKAGHVTIDDLIKNIQSKHPKNQANLLKEEDLSPLLAHKDSVYIFMGAGDIQKYQAAFEKLLTAQA